MQLLSLIPILILLLYLLVSIDLVYTGLCELVLGVYPEGEQMFSKFYSNCGGSGWSLVIGERIEVASV